jgi:RNA polymerase sigma-70 factor, ECF subfamily
MEQEPGLARTFLVHARGHFAPAMEPSALHALLVRTWEKARAAWPTVMLPAEPFVRHLAERLSLDEPPAPLEPQLARLCVEELYLACACLRGEDSALECFEREYLAKLPALLRGPRQSEAMLDDVCQLVRVKILVAAPGEVPRIGEYSGRGTLLSWLRVTAVRIAIKLRQVEKPAPEQDAETVFAALPAPGVDPELDLVRRRHHADFRHAVRESFAVLTSDERHLFRLYFVDQLSMYDLAALFRVNQSTVSRWLKSARQSIYTETQRRLRERLGLSAREFESFLAVIDSQLELGLSQLLREET